MRWIVILHRAPPAKSRRDDKLDRLRQAVHVASALTEETQVVACALEQERPTWGPLLKDFEGLRLVEEPFERGTAAGLAAALGRIAMTDRKADVIVIESTRPPASRLEALQSLSMLQRRRCSQPDHVAVRDGLAFGSIEAWQYLLRKAAPELETVMHDEQQLFALDQVYPYLSASDYRHQVMRFAQCVEHAPVGPTP
jgi:hypothetical protein